MFEWFIWGWVVWLVGSLAVVGFLDLVFFVVWAFWRKEEPQQMHHPRWDE